jgi:hypothetical protein
MGQFLPRKQTSPRWRFIFSRLEPIYQPGFPGLTGAGDRGHPRNHEVEIRRRLFTGEAYYY